MRYVFAEMEHHGSGGGVRITLGLACGVGRTLTWLTADKDTSVQALVVAVILQTCPELGLCIYGRTYAHQDVRAYG
jgi:hypothetical protein